MANFTRAEVLEKLNKIFKEIRNRQFSLKEEDILESLTLDSLDQVEIVLSIEEHYNIDVSEKEARAARSIKELIDLILKYTGAQDAHN